MAEVRACTHQTPRASNKSRSSGQLPRPASSSHGSQERDCPCSDSCKVPSSRPKYVANAGKNADASPLPVRQIHRNPVFGVAAQGTAG